MKYLEFTFQNKPNNETICDLLSGLLGNIGFESFINYENGIKAYIQVEDYKKEEVEEVIKSFPIETEISCSYVEAEDKDWNKEWVKNYFQPITIENKCVVYSTFHENVPMLPYSIVINPKMSFGTGHHETTRLMISEILSNDIINKRVLDMGCGTSILGILASKKGAKSVTGIDIDDWCIDNSLENIRLNHINNLSVEKGDANSLETKGTFDLIIANINRNILLNDMKHYAKCMDKGSEILLSGFYVQDIELIKEEGAKYNLNFVYSKNENNWAVVKLIKE